MQQQETEGTERNTGVAQETIKLDVKKEPETMETTNCDIKPEEKFPTHEGILPLGLWKTLCTNKFFKVIKQNCC